MSPMPYRVIDLQCGCICLTAISPALQPLTLPRQTEQYSATAYAVQLRLVAKTQEHAYPVNFMPHFEFAYLRTLSNTVVHSFHCARVHFPSLAPFARLVISSS
mmetsp:Transcript_11549/g.42248  ORF Transcript_11549/g.42248 Transcript_11549/m.42248 type:complete len:103 (+) Transcript_11549:3301-3609(+)